ncbi:hypothetical protein HGRIS_009099 [Hohenbuehelia grisea]|uniref:Uncharacterized protein n=1 Tax=Hohenbuehelia grisea TaxID=104357 RepID=A0ABR3J1I2_9AGAR
MDDDSAFFRPVSGNYTPARFSHQPFNHLSVFAYIALGVVFTVSGIVLCYALYSCFHVPPGSSTITIGGAYNGYAPQPTAKEKLDTPKTRRWLAFWRLSPQTEDAISEKTASAGSFSGKPLIPPPRAHVRDVPHIRIHPPMTSSPMSTPNPNNASDATLLSVASPKRGRKRTGSLASSGLNISGPIIAGASDGGAAPVLPPPKLARTIVSDVWTNASSKLFPITRALPMARAASSQSSAS